jgi:hypothetical protein
MPPAKAVANGMRDRAKPMIEEITTARRLKERRDIGNSFSGTQRKPGPARLLGRAIVGVGTEAGQVFLNMWGILATIEY